MRVCLQFICLNRVFIYVIHVDRLMQAKIRTCNNFVKLICSKCANKSLTFSNQGGWRPSERTTLSVVRRQKGCTLHAHTLNFLHKQDKRRPGRLSSSNDLLFDLLLPNLSYTLLIFTCRFDSASSCRVYDFTVVMSAASSSFIRLRSLSRICFKNWPVYDFSFIASSSGVPVPMIVPPRLPPSGPRSIT